MIASKEFKLLGSSSLKKCSAHIAKSTSFSRTFCNWTGRSWTHHKVHEAARSECSMTAQTQRRQWRDVTDPMHRTPGRRQLSCRWKLSWQMRGATPFPDEEERQSLISSYTLLAAKTKSSTVILAVQSSQAVLVEGMLPAPWQTLAFP